MVHINIMIHCVHISVLYIERTDPQNRSLHVRTGRNISKHHFTFVLHVHVVDAQHFQVKIIYFCKKKLPLIC